MRQANDTYRNMYKNSPTPYTYPSPNAPFFESKLDSCTKLTAKPKTRRSTKSVVMGKAKVMSYEDIKEARAKRAAKEQATAGKGKRGRKRKSDVLESDASEQRAPVARMI
jgi:hypothetical protein